MLLTSETLKEIYKIDLLTYLQENEPNELVHVSGDTYCTKTHDSLRINNGKWMWFSRGFGGYNALEYLIKVEGLTFNKAVKLLGNMDFENTSKTNLLKKQKDKLLLLPEKNENAKVVIEYLFHRGIDYEIIQDCLKKGIIYESKIHHNAVFIGTDKNNKPRYASYRGTTGTGFKGDASGSDKHYSFKLGFNNETVHIFESAIDALSYATLLKLNTEEWKQYSLLSLGGVYTIKNDKKEVRLYAALKKYLEDNPQTKTIILHLDNDKAGRLATKSIVSCLSDMYKVVDNPMPFGKDVNDFLCVKLGILKQKERNEER